MAAVGTAVRSELDGRVVKAAETALADHQFVTAIDIMVGMGWLTTPQIDRWRQGRVDYLERLVTASPSKISTSMTTFHHWARNEGLTPSETAYLARSRDHRSLRFSKSGDPGIEAAYRTHWICPELSEAKKSRLAEKQGRAPDLVVISPFKEWSCTECAGTGDLLFMEGDGPLCLICADLDHLVFLPAGDAALTRRAKKASGLAAVVVRFSRSRGRYERRGSSSKRRRWPRPSLPAWPMRRQERGAACAKPNTDLSRTRTSRTLLALRSSTSSRAVRNRGPRPLLSMPDPGGVDVSAGVLPDGPSTPMP